MRNLVGREVVECDCVAGTCVWVTQGSPPRLNRLNRTNQTAAVVMVVVGWWGYFLYSVVLRNNLIIGTFHFVQSS